MSMPRPRPSDIAFEGPRLNTGRARRGTSPMQIAVEREISIRDLTKRKSLALVAYCLLCSLLTPYAYSQSAAATVAGTVTDQNGAGLRGVDGALRRTNPGVRRVSKSAAAGT